MGNNSSLELVKQMPVRPWPCLNCVHLREASSNKFAKNHVICGWWDDLKRMPANAIMVTLAGRTDAAQSLTRKQVFGPHKGEPIACHTFQSVESTKEGQGDG